MSAEMEEPQWLQPGLLKDEDDQSGTTGWSFADQRFGAFVFVVAGASVIILLFVIFLREFYWRKYGVDLCPSFVGHRRRANTEQMDRDRLMAEELQRRLNEEEREAERLVKRKERQAWYEKFIQDYTMTATAEDLFYAHETNGPAVHSDDKEKVAPSTADEDHVLPVRKNSATLSISDEEAEEIDDIERSSEAEEICPPVACDATEEDAHLFLRLPVKDRDDICRTVDGSCNICFCDYEEGDKVVWSGLQCRHAFHDACILPWLSKGKKRCPICRHWFVPGARIEDQKKELEERLRIEAAGSSETSDETDDSQSVSETPTPSTEIPTGEVDERSTPQEVLPAQVPSLDIEAGVEQGSIDVACVDRKQALAEMKSASRDFTSENEDLTSDDRTEDDLEAA